MPQDWQAGPAPEDAWTKGPAPTQRPTDSDAGALLTAGKVLPSVAEAATSFAMSPAVPKTAAAIGRVVGAVAPVVGGAAELGPAGALLAIPGMAKGAWAGGKTGWFTGKLAQKAIAPAASVLDKVAPYAQILSTLSGAQGVADLAQMADPDRKDIGVLGIGRTVNVPGAHPALLNQLATKLSEGTRKLMDYGMAKKDAIESVLNSHQIVKAGK